MAGQTHVTVGIVGGGPAGLTLARMLELCGISYTLLEAYSDFAPNSGASLGLNYSGLRILDQIGFIEEFDKYETPHRWWEHRDSQGHLQASFAIQSEYRARIVTLSFEISFGYNLFFMERQKVLEILYDGIEDKSRLHPSTRVVAVRSSEKNAIIVIENGDEISCDFIAGADGVRSIVRHEIESRSFRDERRFPAFDYSTRWSCVYGISSPMAGIGPGRAFTVYSQDASVMVFTGRDDACYWFIFGDLKRAIDYNSPEEFTETDKMEIAAKVADYIVTDGLRFGDIFVQRRTAIMMALEEGVADSFFSGRMFILGDAAHKMVPQGGWGVNQAFESAAVFINYLRSLLANTTNGSITPPKISLSDVEACLQKYATRRQERAAAMVRMASDLCRFQLKVGADSKERWDALGKMSNGMNLKMLLKIFMQADKLEDWHFGSERVARYAEFAEKLRRKEAGANI
ncbi:hypothetical protein N7495_003130 [Penicillium taxi]|uniref:uncharacterized protein n=1 Tax=Penicillium taxi TaxID=168475 RepID=UPI002545ABE0|nr:uncharacterized protein N7495_003130 [Penicillium taxi]KAJ5902602.1 hypothetical protein N7495_003130 [Penicillium taxi]